MKISEIVGTKTPAFDIRAFVSQALDDVFEYESDYPNDEVSIRGIDTTGDHFTVDVESRRSERDVTATIKIIGKEVEVTVFGESHKIEVDSDEEPVELGKDIVGHIAYQVEQKDNEEDEDDYDDEDEDDEGDHEYR